MPPRRHGGRRPRRRRRLDVRVAAAVGVLAALALLVLPAAAAPLRAAPAQARVPLPYRYMTFSAANQAGAVTAGYNLMDVGPYAGTIDALPGGVRALVWLGNYDNATCAFATSDAWVGAHLAPLRGDAKVAGYYIADEPHSGACPAAPRQLAARTALVHRLHPGAFTYAVIEDGDNHPGEYRAFATATDVVGIDPYPCTWRHGCVPSRIDDAVARARAAGIRHLWGVLQAFADSYYRYPSPTEMRQMLDRWRRAGIEGQQTFAWRWAGSSLDGQPGLLRVLRAYNTTG